jgi:hypothetical protein
MKQPLSHYVFEDDGMYNNQWRIYEKPSAPGAMERAFADAWTEQAAKEIFEAVNAARLRDTSHDDELTNHKGDPIYPASGQR